MIPSRHYQTRLGHKVLKMDRVILPTICKWASDPASEQFDEHMSVHDGFPWLVTILIDGKPRKHWYTNGGKWSDRAKCHSEMDLVEVKP